MSAKVDQASAIEPYSVPNTLMTTSSAASPSSSKISKFGPKSGFIIPKNKLSGSLVPSLRGGKKLGGGDAENEESAKQVQRKTKWGPDPTQDAAVRRGRALAYQTRVDQISQQLKSGSLEIGDDQDSSSMAHILDQESSGHQIDDEILKLLEFERLEVVGEILKLNPSYKAPPDYKPLLKEAIVPIPVKEYPGYNFVGLIFGPGSDTVKRLEKETGAKVKVYGTKADTGEKGEITPSDGSEKQGAYGELNVHVLADTFEKVDAAVALIELLVTPVSGNPAAVSTALTTVSADTVNAPNQSQDPATHTVSTTVSNVVVSQPVIGPAQNPPLNQFQMQSGPWIPTGPPHSSSGFIPPLNPSNMPSLFGAPPAPVAGFGSVLQNPARVPPMSLQPMQGFQHPCMPQARPLGHSFPPSSSSLSAPQPSLAQSMLPGPFTSTQSLPAGIPSISKPLMPSLHPLVSKSPLGLLPDQPLTPAGISSGWSGPSGTPASLGSSNAMQMSPLVVLPQRSHFVAPQPIVASRAPPNISTANPVPSFSFPSRPSGPLSSTHVNQPVAAVASSVSLPPPLPVSIHAPTSIQASLQGMHMLPVTARASVPIPSPNHAVGFAPIPSPISLTTAPPMQSGAPAYVSGSLLSFSPLKPPSATALRPQQPSSSDFTFLPPRAQNLTSQAVPRPASQVAVQSAQPPKLVMRPPLAPQAPSFRPAMHNSAPPPVFQAFPRSQISKQLGQPQSQVSAVPFSGNSNAISVMPRLPTFPSAPATPASQMGLRNSNPTPLLPNMASPFPSRPGNPVQVEQNFPAPGIRPAPNQQFGNNSFLHSRPASSPSGGQQIYDPFSPTSVSRVPQQGGNISKVRKQENDPEYEDLMASVGVR